MCVWAFQIKVVQAAMLNMEADLLGSEVRRARQRAGGQPVELGAAHLCSPGDFRSSGHELANRLGTRPPRLHARTIP